MPTSELDARKFVRFLKDNLERIIYSILDAAILERERNPVILELIMAEAHAVAHTKNFNRHQPEDETAWRILSTPIRVALDFEHLRVHVVAEVLHRLSTDALDEYLLEVQTRTMQRMIA